ncbi:MAG: efflux RND transporter periplasmic adaptor subunit [Balneolaceae bacterium]
MKYRCNYLSPLAIFSFSLLLWGCGNSEEGGNTGNFGTIPAVEAVQAQFGALPLEERLSGITRASNQVEIYPRITAPVEEVMVRNGDYVESGAPLIRLEDREYSERLQQAEANLRVNEARARQSETRLNEVRNFLDRQETLYSRDLLSDADIEQARAQVMSAEADYELALAQVDQAHSQMSEQRDLLDRTVIRAPISGTVGQRNAEAGMQVNANSRLFVIGDLTHSTIRVNLTENMLGYIETGQTVRIFSENLGDTLLYSEVSRISPFLTSGSFSTEAEIDIANEEGLLLPGMFVTVDVLYGETSQATLVPLSAIFRHPRTGVQGIYVANGYGVETEPITEVDAGNPPPLSEPTSLEFREIEVVARGREAAGVAGINSGDWVVTVGQSLLIGSADDQDPQARIRAASWDRIMEMQRMQPEDLLERIMGEDVSSGI